MDDTAPIKIRQTTTATKQTKAELSQQYNFGRYGKVREIVAAVSRLRQEGLPIVSNGSLYAALERIYLSLGRDFKIDLNSGGAKETERIERELLSIISNIEKPQEWVEMEVEQMEVSGSDLDSKALNMQDLSKLLDEYQEGIERKEKVTSLEKRLAKKYKIDRSQVKEWISRLEEKVSLLKNKGLGQEVARDVAEKAVIREERLRKDLDRAGVKADQIKTVTSQLVEGQAEAMVSNKDFKVGSLKTDGVKLPTEAVAVVERQARRLKNEINVAQLVEEGQKAFVADLEQGLQTSQPGIVFERHEDNVARLTREAMVKVWAGEYDDLESAEVNIGSVDEPRLVNFKEAVANEIKSDSEVVTIAVRGASQQTNNLIRKNIRVAAEYEFGEKSEGIADTILALNPKIDESVVVDYAEEVTKTTLPLQIPGDRNVRKISDKYGLNEDATASANLFFRVSSGISDYKNLKEVTEKFEEVGGDSGVQIKASPETRTSFRFLGELKRNPLLEKGVSVVKKRAAGSLLTNTTMVEGVTSFISNNLGFSTIFGIETATAVPAVMGYFSAGGNMAGAIKGVIDAGGVANWINGLITAGGATVGATGEVAAGAGATAVTTGVAGTGATVAGGTAAAGATVATGGIAAVVIAVGAVITAGAKILKKVVGNVRDSLESMGIDTSVLNIFSKTKIQAKEKLGGLLGGVAGFVLDVGNMMVWTIGLAFSMAMAAIIKMIAPVVVGVFLFIFVYQTLVPILHGSAMVPGKESMGLIGSGLEYDLPYIDVNPIFGEECELTLACVAMEALLQNGFVRVVPENIDRAVSILRNLISVHPQFNIARFNTVMEYNTNKYNAFQCIGYSIASDPDLTTSPSWQLLYSGEQPGCGKIAPENAGVDDHIVFPLRNGHYHIGVLVAVRLDGSGIMYDVNYDGNGSLHKWPILNIVDFVSGNNQRNPGQELTILRCGI